MNSEWENYCRKLTTKENLSPVEASLSIFFHLEMLTETVYLWKLSRGVYQMIKSFLFRYPKTGFLKRKAKKEQQEIKKLFLYVSEMYQDVRAIGTVEEQKVVHNKNLVERIYQEKIDLQSSTNWKFITLGFLGDRAQPAHLLVPYIQQQMRVPEIEASHQNIHDKIEMIEKIRNCPLCDREFLDTLYLRLRSLCVSLEESGPQKAKFVFLYTGME